MYNPKKDHLQVVFRILRYFKGSLEKGLLFFKQDKSLDVEAFTNADQASFVDDKSSTSGYCTFLGGNLITQIRKKQTIVVRSDAEAKFKALALGICELIWIKSLMSELRMPLMIPMKLYWDNKVVIKIAHNPVQHDRTMHVEIDQHFIKEKI